MLIAFTVVIIFASLKKSRTSDPCVARLLDSLLVFMVNICYTSLPQQTCIHLRMQLRSYIATSYGHCFFTIQPQEHLEFSNKNTPPFIELSYSTPGFLSPSNFSSSSLCIFLSCGHLIFLVTNLTLYLRISVYIIFKQLFTTIAQKMSPVTLYFELCIYTYLWIVPKYYLVLIQYSISMYFVILHFVLCMSMRT